MPRWQYNGIFVLRSWLRCSVVMVSPPHKWHRVSGKKKTSALFFTTSLVVIRWQHSPPHSPLVESSLSPREGPARGHKHSTIRFFFFEFLAPQNASADLSACPRRIVMPEWQALNKNKHPESPTLSDSQLPTDLSHLSNDHPCEKLRKQLQQWLLSLHITAGDMLQYSLALSKPSSAAKMH